MLARVPNLATRRQRLLFRLVAPSTFLASIVLGFWSLHALGWNEIHRIGQTRATQLWDRLIPGVDEPVLGSSYSQVLAVSILCTEFGLTHTLQAGLLAPENVPEVPTNNQMHLSDQVRTVLWFLEIARFAILPGRCNRTFVYISGYT